MWLPPPPHHHQRAGKGSALAQEVEQLKRMLKAGAEWDVVSQMMSLISDKAAQVESMAVSGEASGGAPTVNADATPQSRGVARILSRVSVSACCLGMQPNTLVRKPLNAPSCRPLLCSPPCPWGPAAQWQLARPRLACSAWGLT